MRDDEEWWWTVIYCEGKSEKIFYQFRETKRKGSETVQMGDRNPGGFDSWEKCQKISWHFRRKIGRSRGWCFCSIFNDHANSHPLVKDTQNYQLWPVGLQKVLCGAHGAQWRHLPQPTPGTRGKIQLLMTSLTAHGAWWRHLSQPTPGTRGKILYICSWRH